MKMSSDRPAEEMTQFQTGATRSAEEGKPDFSGILSAWAIELFGRYMVRHQTQADGKKRSANNWKKGMPPQRYLASLSRHFFDLSKAADRMMLREDTSPETKAAFEEALGGVIFNAMGLAHEWEIEKEKYVASGDASYDFLRRAREAVRAYDAFPGSSGECPSTEGQSTQSSPRQRRQANVRRARQRKLPKR